MYTTALYITLYFWNGLEDYRNLCEVVTKSCLFHYVSSALKHVTVNYIIIIIFCYLRHVCIVLFVPGGDTGYYPILYTWTNRLSFAGMIKEN